MRRLILTLTSTLCLLCTATVSAAVTGHDSYPGPLAHSAQNPLAAPLAANTITPQNYARFGPGSNGQYWAVLRALQYWNASYSPCNQDVTITWWPLDPSINADTTWTNPVSAYGAPWANYHCITVFNYNINFDWPMYCTVMVHEIGHLYGFQHSPDPNNVMYYAYVKPVPSCVLTPPGV